MNKWERYEVLKKSIRADSPQEYEQKIGKLIKKLNI